MEVAVKAVPDQDMLRYRMQEAEEHMQIINKNFQEIVKKIEDNRVEIALTRSNLECLKNRDTTLRYDVARRNEILVPLHLALDKLSFANNAYQDKFIKNPCLPEEIDYRRLSFKMMHGNNNLQQERKLLMESKSMEGKETDCSCSSLEDIHSKIRRLRYRQICSSMFTWKDGEKEIFQQQIKLLESDKEKVIANYAVGGKPWRSLGLRKDIRNQIDAEHKEADKMRVIHRRVQVGISRVTKELNRLLKGECKLGSQMVDLRQRKQKVFEHILDLRKEQDMLFRSI